jgi:hypothetical protein
MGDLRACLKSKLATSPICSDGSGVYLFDIVMDSLDDIFGGLAGSLPHIGDPDRQHIPSIPFLCAEDVIEHHEHGSNMSPNASFEADKDLHNPKKRRGKGRAKKLTDGRPHILGADILGAAEVQGAVSLITDQPGDRSEISAVACAHF